MRLKVCVFVVILAAVAAPALCLAEDAGGSPFREKAPLDNRQSLKRLTALFIITLLVLLVMVFVMVILGLFLRRNMRALDERPSEGPTELEDLWWESNPREDDKEDDK